MIDEHAQAFLALLTGAGLTVHAERVPDGVDVDANPYVKPWFDSADPESTKEALPWRFETTMTLHCVAGNERAARMIADTARAALLGVTPAIAGRSCFPITREPGTPPQSDEMTGKRVVNHVDLYTLRSLPG